MLLPEAGVSIEEEAVLEQDRSVRQTDIAVAGEKAAEERKLP